MILGITKSSSENLSAAYHKDETYLYAACSSTLNTMSKKYDHLKAKSEELTDNIILKNRLLEKERVLNETKDHAAHLENSNQRLKNEVYCYREKYHKYKKLYRHVLKTDKLE